MKNKSSDSFEFIKHSLQSYEEEYIPGSWENFLQQRKSNRRKLFLRVASGIAASLLIFLAGSTFYNPERNPVPLNRAEQVSNPPATALPAENSPADEPASAEATTPSPATAPLRERADRKVHTPPARTVAATAQNRVATQPAVRESITDKKPEISAPAAGLAAERLRETPDTARITKDTVNVPARELYRGTPSTAGTAASTEISKRKVRFGVNFSPGISTAESSGSFNYTGGLSADIPLSSSLQLTTGLQVENQSIVKNVPGIVSSSNSPQNQEKTKVTNLDVPLNITWKFFSERSRSYYVSAGLSSLVYLWEQDKNTTYSQDLVPVASLVSGQEVLSYKVVNQVSVDQYAGTPDQTFDLAGRVNILVGFETRLSGKLQLHIEPYAKIPTSSQAPAALNHTSTGINFKISF